MLLVLVRTFGAGIYEKQIFSALFNAEIMQIHFTPKVSIFLLNRVRICLSNLTSEQNDKTIQQKTKAAKDLHCMSRPPTDVAHANPTKHSCPATSGKS